MAHEMLSAIENAFPDLIVEACPHSGSYANSGSRSSLLQQFPWHDKVSLAGWDKKDGD